MKAETITKEDLPKIREWIQTDSFHRDDPRCIAEGMLTGNGLLTFKIVDDKGIICFVRLDVDGIFVRIATQFGPDTEVHKKRVIRAIRNLGIPLAIAAAKKDNAAGLIFESVSPLLISFMKRLNFQPLGNNDYVLEFEE